MELFTDFISHTRENVKFDQFDPKAQGDNLEQANHLVAEVYKQ